MSNKKDERFKINAKPDEVLRVLLGKKQKPPKKAASTKTKTKQADH